MTLASQEVMAGMHVVSNDLSDANGFTLSMVCRNEMYLLPAFLAHYRALGVERFLIVDDRSDDGSRAYLAQQPDVMVIGSAHRYKEPVVTPYIPIKGIAKDFRAELAWRTYLLDTFCRDRWSLHVDADEFLYLPPGTTLPDLAARCDPREGEIVWGIMLDAYPESILDLQAARHDDTIDMEAQWYFDSRPHVMIPENDFPVLRYSGATARLRARYGHATFKNMRARLKWWLRREPPRYIPLYKPSLIHWRAGDAFISSHRLTKFGRADKLLPLLHMKFTGALYDKIAFAVETGAYADGSRNYVMLQKILHRMLKRNDPFTYKGSRLVDGFSAFEETGNAFGLR